MPSLKTAHPKYRLHKASGQAVVTLNGRDHYLGPHGSSESREKYDALIAQWLAGGRRIQAKTPHEATVEQLLAAYWVHAESYYRDDEGQPTSELDSYRQIMKPLREGFGALPCGKFGPSSYKSLRDGLINRGLVRTSINQRMGRVRRILRWGVENELVAPAVVQALDAVAGLKVGRTEAKERTPIKPVDPEQVEAVFPHVTRQVEAMIRLQLLTGMRPGEVIRMRLSEIDRTKSDCWTYQPARHKTSWRGKVRRVPLAASAQEILQEFLPRDADAYLFSPAEAMREARSKRTKNSTGESSKVVFKRHRNPKKQPGDKYSTASYDRAVRNGCRKAQVERWTPNQLRHTYATYIRREHGLEAAQTLLGHSSLDVTQVYAEQDFEKAKRIAIAEGSLDGRKRG